MPGDNRNPSFRRANHGHGGKYISSDGYVLVYSPNYPNAMKNGCIQEHRLVMENKIGRYLLPNETVHHINGIKDDNRPENLKLVSRHDHVIYNELCAKCELRAEVSELRRQIRLMANCQY
jgi:hypothetical protein